MVAKVFSGDATGDCQPMPWDVASGTVPKATHPLEYRTHQESNTNVADTEAELQRVKAKLAQLEVERDRLVREARDAGQQAGEAAGRQAAEAEIQPVMQRLVASIQQVSELPGLLRAQAETELVRLAVAIAKRILQRELNVDPEVITGLVRVGLEKVRVQDVIRVRVCPEHQAAVRECFAHSGATHVEVTADPTQERGSMIFETSRGKLDVSIGTQLREIERGLTDRLRGQG